MTILCIKVLLVPFLVTAVSLTARRFGPRVGGFVATIPIVAGPLILVIALEQGVVFARFASLGALQGLLSVLAFSLVYGFSCRRLFWWQALLLSWGAFAACTTLFAIAHIESLPAFSLVLLSTVGASYALRSLSSAECAPSYSPLLLVERLFASVFLVLFVSALSVALGPKVSGLLAPFPIVGSILCTFTHRQEGYSGVRRLLVGYVDGLYGYAVFFFLVTHLVEHQPIWITFSSALVACLVGQGAALYLSSRIARSGWGDRKTEQWFNDNENLGWEQ